MIRYIYGEDGYYRRIPFMEAHKDFISSLEKEDTWIIGSKQSLILKVTSSHIRVDYFW